MIATAKLEYIEAGGTEEEIPQFEADDIISVTPTEQWLWKKAAILWRARAERAEKALKNAGIG